MDAGIAALRQDLPGWLASFRMAGPPGSAAPEIVLTAANTETVITHVSAGLADIGFIEGPRQPKSLHSKVVGHDRLAVVVAPGHPWARRRRGISAAELAGTALVSREGGSGTRDTLSAALGPDTTQAQPALSLSTTAAVRAAVLAAAAPAVISELAIADDLNAGRLVQIPAPELDLRRTLRAIWDGGQNPPAGVARDLVAHILGRRLREHGRGATRGRTTVSGPPRTRPLPEGR